MTSWYRNVLTDMLASSRKPSGINNFGFISQSFEVKDSTVTLTLDFFSCLIALSAVLSPTPSMPEQ